MVGEKIEEDFEFLKEDERILAVLIFGSRVGGETHGKSDTDICIVAPGSDPWSVLREIFPKVDTEKKGYDVHTFEELTLKMKHEVMENHKIVWCRDEFELQEYFYNYWKIWNDQAKARDVA